MAASGLSCKRRHAYGLERARYNPPSPAGNNVLCANFPQAQIYEGKFVFVGFGSNKRNSDSRQCVRYKISAVRKKPVYGGAV